MFSLWQQDASIGCTSSEIMMKWSLAICGFVTKPQQNLHHVWWDSVKGNPEATTINIKSQ